MYKIYYTSKEFNPHNIPTEKVPLLVKMDDMSFEEIPTRWFFFLATESGNTISSETWRSYADAIYDWFQTCAANHWDWESITREHLISYRNNMLNNKNAHGREYAKNTINGYIKRICFFYEWAYKNKHIETLPFQQGEVSVKVNTKDSNFFAHLDNKNVIYKNDLIVKTSKKIPHCLSTIELKEFLSILDERDSLMVKWAVLTGMRRKEVLGLKLKDIPNSANSNDPIQKIEITITKGGKPRIIFVPISLLDETNRYIKITRRNIARKFNTFNKTDGLWLGKTTGLPITNKALNKNCSEAFKKINIQATFHHLRHTYAIKMLSILTKQSKDSTGLNPLKTLQSLLGHSSIATTMIYLQSLNIDLAEIESSLTELYGDILNEEKL